MQGPSHRRHPDDPAVEDGVHQRRAIESAKTAPETDERGTGELGLQTGHLLDGVGRRPGVARQEQLPRQEGTIQIAAREDPGRRRHVDALLLTLVGSPA
jgi:hypothetical protein